MKLENRRRMLVACWLALTCWICCAPALAAPPPEPGAGITRGDAPSWVLAHQIPQPDASTVAQSSDGVTWLLLDAQVHGEDGGYASYDREAKQVKDRSGLEQAGAVRVEFDPRNETVTLNHVHVIRDGKIIDHTQDLNLEIIRRESDLEGGITDGRVTAVGNITDVRVGDTVDFAVTTRTSTPLWRGHFFRTISTRWSTPVPLRVMRITWPSDRPIRFKAINTDAAFSRTVAGADTVYELIQRDAKPQEPEKNVPDWKPQFGLVSMSTMRSWQEVADWALPLYQGDDRLEGEFAAEVDRIAARWTNPADRLTEATRLVQDRIRYVGVEVGEGSFVPRRPAEVVRMGYGDCKDKSLLLTVVLRRLGIEAAPVLVATGWGKGLPDWAPAPTDFDHAIVRAELDGKPVWIDPTLAHQGGRGAGMATPDYGWVLPIRAQQRDLERITPPTPTADQQQVLEHFDVDEAGETAVRLRVETTYRSGSADWMRASLATNPASELAKHYLDYYLGYYPGLVEAKPLAVEDDREANVVRTVETYTMPRAAFDQGKLLARFPVRADAVLSALPPKQNQPRVNDLYIRPDLRRTHVVELNVKGRRLAILPDIDETVGGFHFKRTSRLDGDGAVLSFTLATSGDGSVPAAKAAAVYAFADKLKDDAYLEYHFDKSNRSLADHLDVTPQDIAPFEARIGQVGALLDKADSASIMQALTLLNAMSAEAKRPSAIAGVIDGLKGSALAMAQRYPAAEAALESSVSQYQGNPEMLQVLAALQLQARKPVAAVHTLQILAKRYPERVKALKEDFIRAGISLLATDHSPTGQSARDDLYILLAQSGWQQGSMSALEEAIRSQAIELLLDRGRTAEARQLFAVAPIGAEAAAALAIDDRYRALWPDLEGAVHDQFRSLVAQDVARSGAALAKAPDDLRLMTAHLRALRRANQPEKAVQVARAAVADHDRIEAAGDDGFWLVNEYASALFDAGRHDEALAQMGWVVGLDPGRYPALVSQAINRAEMLQSAGRPADALAAFNALGDQGASNYGKMWIWSGMVCAAHALDKAEVVKQAMTKLEGLQDDNPAAMTTALACLNETDRLEAMLIKRLDDPRQRTVVLGGFSKSSRGARTEVERKLDAVMDAARQAPAVAAKFKSYGRAVTFAGRPESWQD